MLNVSCPGVEDPGDVIDDLERAIEAAT